MNRIIFVLIVALTNSSFASQSKPDTGKEARTDFEGVWVLDKSKSKVAPNREDAQSMIWLVQQSDKSLSVEPIIRGTNGRMNVAIKVVWRLDGTERSDEVVQSDTRRHSTTKAKWLDNGKVLEVTRHVKTTVEGKETTENSIARFELADGGKTLIVNENVNQGKEERRYVLYKSQYIDQLIRQ